MSDDSEVERISNSGKAPTHRFPDDMPTGAELRGAVPLDELRELADEWEESSEQDAANDFTHAAGTWAVAAKELREVIGEYE